MPQRELQPPVAIAGTITPQEAADALRVSRAHIYDLLAEGEILAFRVGKSWRIPRDLFEQKFSVHSPVSSPK